MEKLSIDMIAELMYQEADLDYWLDYNDLTFVDALKYLILSGQIEVPEWIWVDEEELNERSAET